VATETAVDVVMPQMGVSVSEGTITKWLKTEGEQVEADESLLEISTDKVDTEVPSPASGTLTQILVQEGETVEVGTKLAQIGGAPSGNGQAQAATPERRPRRKPPLAPRARRPPPPRSRRLGRPNLSSNPSPSPSLRPLLPVTVSATVRASSPPSWRGSPRNTASIPARCRAAAAAAA